MSGHRRALLLGPPVALVAGAAALAWLSRPPVGAGPAPSPRDAAACDSRPVGRAGPGTWWEQRQQLDAAGSLSGWRLRAGVAGGRPVEIGLPPESAVAGPVDGIVVLATDDGAGSLIRLLSPREGCLWTVARSEPIVRRAVATPDGIVAHLVERASRRDLGIWLYARDTTAGAPPLRILEPVADPLILAAGIDRVWTTDLRLAGDGRRLAVQSCGERHCLTRILDPASAAAPVVVTDERQGGLIGLGPDGLVTWEACDGLPCAVLLAPPWGGARTVADSVVAAALSGTGRVVVTVVDGDGERNVGIDPRTGDRATIPGGAAGSRPLSVGPGAMHGLEVAADEVAVGADGSLAAVRAGGEAAR